MNIIEFTEKYLVTYIARKNEWSDGVELQDYEKDFLTSLVEDRLTITVASRQMHMSTLLCVYIAYNLIFGDKGRVTLVDTKMDFVAEKINKIRLTIDNYNKKSSAGLKFRLDTKREIMLSNGNSVIGVSSSKDAFRGRYTDIVIIDNAAYIDNLNELYGALVPTVETNGIIHLVSAANNVNFFYTMLMNAGERSPFKKNSYHYSLNSYYTPEAIKNSKRFIDEKSWRREMEMEFQFSTAPQRTRNLQVRVDGETYINVTKRLVELNLNTSEYLHKLIIEDLHRNQSQASF